MIQYGADELRFVECCQSTLEIDLSGYLIVHYQKQTLHQSFKHWGIRWGTQWRQINHRNVVWITSPRVRQQCP